MIYHVVKRSRHRHVRIGRRWSIGHRPGFAEEFSMTHIDDT